ncbi:MAG: TIR domain-containing protein [Steroidobacteraceae bacterium]
MADIFISYARHDKALVATLVAALESEGWSVWWDPQIVAGQEFDERIAEEIDHASAVVVVWTPASVASRWVRGEAREAADRGILVPVRFESARLPIDARAVHTIDLDDWKGDRQSSAFGSLSRALGGLVARARRGNEAAAPRPAAFNDGASGPDDGSVSIAVLPFVNMSSDAEQEYFSDGLSEELINQLVKAKRLRVTGRTSSFVFKGRTDDLRLIGQRLGVSHVLEGSVRKAGSRLRITAQLVKCRDGFHLWSETYDRQLDDVFAIQDEVATAVAEALGVAFGFGEAAPGPAPTTRVDAYDKYLRGRALLHQQGAAELRRAIEIFREAIALDPDFVPAWRGLYRAHQDSILWVAESTEAALAGMAEAAARIEALTPDAWWSHALRADQLDAQRRWLDAEAAAEAALAGAPASEADCIRTYGQLLINVGRLKEAIPFWERARRMDPLSLLASLILQAALDFSGRRAEAELEYERSKDLSGDRDMVEYLALFRALPSGETVMIRGLLGRVMTHQAVPVSGLEDLPAVFGQPEVMLERLRQARTDPANQDATRQYKIALWAAWHGDASLAAGALRRFAIDLSSPRCGAIWHPALSEARKTPAFKAIACDLGLADYWRRSGKWGDFARPAGRDEFEIIQ